MKIAWLTDVHLNFCPDRVQELLDRVDATEADAVLLGGLGGLGGLGDWRRESAIDRPGCPGYDRLPVVLLRYPG